MRIAERDWLAQFDWRRRLLMGGDDPPLDPMAASMTAEAAPMNWRTEAI
jgi:hypothetical protein